MILYECGLLYASYRLKKILLGRHNCLLEMIYRNICNDPFFSEIKSVIFHHFPPKTKKKKNLDQMGEEIFAEKKGQCYLLERHLCLTSVCAD